jgi:murein DD-endopeptidase
MILPLSQFATVSQHFGVPSKHYRSGVHNGTDFPVPVGTPIFCPANGEVYKVFKNHRTMGNAVYFKFNDIPFHMRLLHLRECPPVRSYTQGEVMAYSGDSGDSTGPHLHLEIWSVPINPLLLYSRVNVFKYLLDPYKWFKERVIN